jgi:hypothetical protein
VTRLSWLVCGRCYFGVGLLATALTCSWAEPMAMSWPADEENNRTVGAVEAEVKPCNLQQERSFGLRTTTLTLPGKRLTLVG